MTFGESLLIFKLEWFFTSVTSENDRFPELKYVSFLNVHCMAKSVCTYSCVPSKTTGIKHRSVGSSSNKDKENINFGHSLESHQSSTWWVFTYSKQTKAYIWNKKLPTVLMTETTGFFYSRDFPTSEQWAKPHNCFSTPKLASSFKFICEVWFNLHTT